MRSTTGSRLGGSLKRRRATTVMGQEATSFANGISVAAKILNQDRRVAASKKGADPIIN